MIRAAIVVVTGSRGGACRSRCRDVLGPGTGTGPTFVEHVVSHGKKIFMYFN